ncbi:helix-turn-helix transcriptional regulator [Burkholderia oklahomensis]|uniref:Helix-turn-helix family protein n=1 Tax=Burkholderia oklahomensis TaxID=342113 RepID=A0AAI8FQ68_9BURK|nr:helix-turn-helix transcriptional regulator [Burkholderia oklahomensis]AIO68660.1 helix-turn-helix family protein [Burkholderia oklahomensis]AJX36212.1 helix-turn-helix family protein [Burkholderia oklahomensis C6786]AOI38925.1 gluconate transporter [Burkholderia oklahomensis EO147]AOI48628.1 gluconate transporter [Burkholderia oklahomensis C6786]KUY47414.1 gluconate transporter [Burkholderia oklahomensis C6786]
MAITIEHEIKTLGQLRPILRGFRKAAGLTQAMLASRLGVTQQTYAQFEANPASASVERLFKVLRVLDVELTLTLTHVYVAPAKPAAKQTVAAPARKAVKTVGSGRVAAKRPASPTSQSAPGPHAAERLPRSPRKRAAPKKREDW